MTGGRDVIPGPQLPGAVTGVTIALGWWLIVLSTHGDYGAPTGFDAVWNDRLVGLVAVALGVLRALGRVPLTVATAAGTAVGGWLVLAPLLLDYGFSTDSTLATLTDFAIGVTITALTVAGALDRGIGARLPADVDVVTRP